MSTFIYSLEDDYTGKVINYATHRLSSQLSKAIEKGKDRDACEKLINAGADVNAKDKYGYTPLHKAVDTGNIQIINLLIEKEADVNAATEDGDTPLHEAVNTGNTQIINLLIEKGADVNATGKWGNTPLHKAGFRENLGVAQLLIDNKADVNAKDSSGQTPLHEAARRIGVKMAKLLIENGADVHATNHSGETPLHMMAKIRPEDVRVHHENCFKLFELLIENKADVNAKTPRGRTPYHEAAYWGHLEIAALLVNQGAEVDIKITRLLWTPLHLAAATGDLVNCKLLIKSKEVEIDADRLKREWSQSWVIDDIGHTALHDAVFFGKYDVCEFLIESGANVNAKSDSGRTPLHLAARRGYYEIAKLLIEKGASVNVGNNNRVTPLELTKNPKIRELLISHQNKTSD